MSEQVDAVVIGAGMGGLSAALGLARGGLKVEVIEAAEAAGGKVATAEVDGVRFDTGPSLMTLTHVLEEVLAAGGARLEDELELLRPDLVFRYLYADGVALELYQRVEDTLESVRQTLGPPAADQLKAFLDYAREIWEAALPNFVMGSAPNVTGMMRLGMTKLGQVMKIDPLRTMWAGICRHVQDPHLRMLLARYATYNGSNPYAAPATLNCIAWVELGLGCCGVRGGMSQIAAALARVGARQGVNYSYGDPVAQVLIERGRAVGVTTRSGRTVRARIIVANADVAQVIGGLLPTGIAHGLEETQEPSMSGWNGVLRARPGAMTQAAHTVLFPNDYAQEFEDIFGQRRPPREPTVYLCAQGVGHGREGWEDGSQPVFVMANAPCEPATGSSDPAQYEALRERVMGRLREAGLLGLDDALVWQRTPAQLAAQFPGSRGSIYGASSNSQLAAFRRPANRVKALPGLYLASGSAHPGGGVPMCLMSGQTASREALEDHGQGAQAAPSRKLWSRA